LETFSHAEEVVLQDYEDRLIAAAKPGEYVTVFWTKDKAQELLALAEKSDAQVPTTTA
jgi:hypothetical protein